MKKKAGEERMGSPMIDGFKSGVRIDIEGTGLSIGIKHRDFLYLSGALSMLTTFSEKKGNYWATVSLNGTEVRVECNQRGERYFFNVSGNPISFITGQNLIGTCNLPMLTKKLYIGVTRAIQEKVASFKMPERVREAVENLEMHVSGLSFAMYTPELQFKDWAKVKHLLNVIDYLYAAGMGDNQTVKEYLGLKVYRQGDFSLLFEKQVGNHKYWTLRLYNKHQESVDKAKLLGIRDMLETDFVKDRLRLDLTLFSGFFQRNRLTTLKSIHERYGKDYAGWATQLVDRALDEMRLRYLLTFRFYKVDPSVYEDWFNLYLSGEAEPPTSMCKSWFESQGIDVTLPVDLHFAVAKARSSFAIEGKKSGGRALVGDKSVQKYISAMFWNGLINADYLPAFKRALLLRPDEKFPAFKQTEGGFVNMDTGEVIEVRPMGVEHA